MIYVFTVVPELSDSMLFFSLLMDNCISICTPHENYLHHKLTTYTPSGGVTRNWMGVPRQLHLPGENVRCACIQESLLSDPKLKEYPNCKPDSTACKIKL